MKKDALAALEEWQISRLTGNPDLEQEKATAMMKAVKAALTHEAEAVDLDQLYRGAANEDEAMCQVTSIYNDGWNAAIDHLASTGRIRGGADLAPQSDEKETIAKWMIFHGFTTGHGDTVEGLLNELSWQIAADVKPKWRPIEEWHEDHGPAFWTRFPVQEPFYSGSPLDVDWPEDYYTHFIPMSVFYCTLDSDGMPLPQPPAEGE